MIVAVVAVVVAVAGVVVGVVVADGTVALRGGGREERHTGEAYWMQLGNGDLVENQFVSVTHISAGRNPHRWRHPPGASSFLTESNRLKT